MRMQDGRWKSRRTGSLTGSVRLRTNMETGERKKNDYEKPTIRRVSLVAEEVLAVGCKLGTGPGPFGATCTAVPCNQPGS
jgi:hypothetical protein